MSRTMYGVLISYNQPLIRCTHLRTLTAAEELSIGMPIQQIIHAQCWVK